MAVVRRVDESERGQIRRFAILAVGMPRDENKLLPGVCKKTRAVLRRVDESERGQIRRLLPWYFSTTLTAVSFVFCCPGRRHAT
jgi:hypothetical protein